MGGSGTQTVCGDAARAVGMLLAPLGKTALGGLPFTSILGRPLVPHKRVRQQWHHCTPVRRKNRCPQHRRQRGERTMAVDLVQTRGAVQGLGGQIGCPIARQSRVSSTKRHRCKGRATLAVSQDALAHRAEHLWGDRGKDGAPRRVARDPLHAVEGGHMALGPCLVTGSKRGRCEGKQGTGRHERLGAGHLGIATTVLWQAGTTALHQAKERIGGQRRPSLWRHESPKTPRHADIASFL